MSYMYEGCACQQISSTSGCCATVILTNHVTAPLGIVSAPLAKSDGRNVNSTNGHGASLNSVRLNLRCDCPHRRYYYRHLMNSKIAYDVYHGTKDRTLRLATMPGAGLPNHLKRKDWVLMPAGKSLLHSDAARDVGVRGYCFFQVVEA